MKRTVLRPPGPGIAATTAQHSRPSRSSKNDELNGESPPGSPDNRITLAVLEQHPAERGKGYDPYNAGASPMDIQAWKRRQKPG